MPFPRRIDCRDREKLSVTDSSMPHLERTNTRRFTAWLMWRMEWARTFISFS